MRIIDHRVLHRRVSTDKHHRNSGLRCGRSHVRRRSLSDVRRTLRYATVLPRHGLCHHIHRRVPYTAVRSPR